MAAGGLMRRHTLGLAGALCAVLCAGPASPQGGAAGVSPPGGESFRFAVVGDSQPHNAYALPNKVYGMILDRVNKLGVDFVLHVGDVVEGYCNLGTFKRQLTEFIDSSRKLKVPCYIAFGNHDMSVPQGRGDLSRMLGQPFYQSFHHKGAYFVLLNTSMLDPDRHGVLSEEQFQWLSKMLAENKDKKPIFVCLHHPVFSREPIADSRRLHSLLLRHGVAGVFSGHEHLYRAEEHDGIRYYVTGGGGGPLFLEDDGGIYHFLLVTVEDGNWRVDLQKVDGGTGGVFRVGGELQSPLVMKTIKEQTGGIGAADGTGTTSSGEDADLRAGALRLQAGEYEAAVDACRRALIPDPANIPALQTLALARILQNRERWEAYPYLHTRKSFGELKELNDIFTTLLSLESNGSSRAQALNNYAVMLYLGGLAPAEAIEQYLNDAIASDPTLPEPHVNLGNIQWQGQRVGPAGLSYLRALKLDPGCSAAKHNLATILVLDGKIDEGIDVYRELVAQDPSNYKVLNSLADAYLHRYQAAPARTRDLLLARDTLRESLRIKPSQTMAGVMLRKIAKDQPEFHETVGIR